MDKAQIERLKELQQEIKSLCEDRLEARTAGGLVLAEALDEVLEILTAAKGK